MGVKGCSPEKAEETDKVKMVTGTKEVSQVNEEAGGSSELKEEKEGGKSMIHKNEVEVGKEEVADVKGQEGEIHKIKEGTDKTESMICEQEVEEDDKGKGGCSEENNENEKGVSVIHKIDTGEMTDLDISCDLVIDESVGAYENNGKSVSFDLKDKCADVGSGSSTLEGMVDTFPKEGEQDTKQSQEVSEPIDSSDTIPAEDIEIPEDEFDLEDDIPLMQNVQRPRYIKLEKQEDEDKNGVYSDNNTEPDGKWGKLKR